MVTLQTAENALKTVYLGVVSDQLSILMLMFGVKKLENLHHSELMVVLVQEQKMEFYQKLLETNMFNL